MADGKKRRKQLAAMCAGGVAVFGVVCAAAVVVAAGAGSAPTAVAETTATDWAAMANGALDADGFDFASATMDGKVLTITGDAPDAAGREAAYAAGIDAVKADRKHVGEVLAFANAMTVAGAAVASVPDAASALGEEPGAE
ncbi:MAG: hypothetical protein MUF14_04170, partial [Hyphomonadaceae bacterium]|nr:hypothetical protein [Hyphomonadaceae bacterium]